MLKKSSLHIASRGNGDSSGKVEVDYFPTEPCFVDLLVDRGQLKHKKVWEPACGDGSISERLKSRGFDVVSEDLHDYGYGRHGVDFMTSTPPMFEFANLENERVDSLITNPPFCLFEQFFHRAWSHWQVEELALLCSVPSLAASKRRQREVFAAYPPARILLVVDKMRIRGVDGSCRISVFNHAWVIWQKNTSKKKRETVIDICTLPPDAVRLKTSKAVSK